MIDENRALEQEWITLQKGYQQSEIMALIIKLLSVVVCLVGVLINEAVLIALLLILVLWAQEAIWKTFQARTEQRLLAIEEARANNLAHSAYRLYTDWSMSRPGTTELMREYIRNSTRPTIAFPYVILIPFLFIASPV